LINTIITAFEFLEENSDDETKELDSFIFVLTKKVKFQDYPTLYVDELQKRRANFFFSNANNFFLEKIKLKKQFQLFYNASSNTINFLYY
jgi:hypothetical protein